jgi:hypothetical protein
MKTVHVTTNFTAGEMSPRVRGRVDIAQYSAGAKRLRNAYPVVTGGAVSRPGTTFTAAAKNASKKCRVIPFVIKRGAVYVIELGESYARIYKNGVVIGAPLELAHPYTEAQLMDIDYAQDASTMYLAHEAHPIQRIRRLSDTVWSCEAAPFTTVPYEEVGRRPAVSLTLSAATVGSGRTVTASGAAFLAADVGRAILYETGVLVITGYTSTTQVTGTITLAFQGTAVPSGVWTLDSSPQTTCTPSAKDPVGASTTLTLGAAGWRSDDVGSHVVINGGLCKITGYTSTTVVDAVIVQELSSTAAAPALAWQLKPPQWNATDGYPRTVTLHQQRLIAAGSPGYPQTIWGSRTGEPLDFTVQANDSAGYSFTIGSDENNQISYLAATRHLMALTFGAEYSLRGQNAKSIISTLNPPDIVSESNHGSATVRPVTIRKELMFVQRAGKEVRSLGYRYDFDGYDAPDVSALADHLFGKLADGTSLSVVDMAYQQRPHSLLWCVRSDGQVVSITIDRGQGVVGLALHDFGGVAESVCSVPTDDGDAVYFVMRRTINGSTARYIERLEMTTTSTRLSERNLMQLDMGLSTYSAGGTTTLTVAHLPNTEIDILIDGVYGGRVTTNGSGVATLPRTAYSVQGGLPFVSVIEPNSPEDAQGAGAAVGQRLSTSRVIARLLDSGAMTINEQSVEFRQFGVDVLDQPAPLFTGDYPISELGWYDGESPVVIERALPFPVHVLSIIRDLSVNQG